MDVTWHERIGHDLPPPQKRRTLNSKFTIQNSLFETCVEQPQGDLLRAVVDNLTGFDGSHALALFFVGVDL